MKKVCISFLFIGIIILAMVAYFKPQYQTEYLRIHIRANSNEEIDQAVKLEVKEAVVAFLTPIISECHTKEDATFALSSNLKNIEKVANGVLKNNGFGYESRAGIKNEEFPTRVYEEVTLEKGFYDALIIELGEGKGDNWWCVVYPPLCFLNEGKGIVYKSKIKEIIEEFLS